MKKIFLLVFIVIAIGIVTGCSNKQEETMVLLDEEISKIILSNSLGKGDINLKELKSFEDDEFISIFEKAIKTATKQNVSHTLGKPDYDIQVQYSEGYPTHAIHLWLGEEGETSTLMYTIYDEDVSYLTTINMANKLRKIILSAQAS